MPLPTEPSRWPRETSILRHMPLFTLSRTLQFISDKMETLDTRLQALRGPAGTPQGFGSWTSISLVSQTPAPCTALTSHFRALAPAQSTLADPSGTVSVGRSLLMTCFSSLTSPPDCRAQPLLSGSSHDLSILKGSLPGPGDCDPQLWPVLAA